MSACGIRGGYAEWDCVLDKGHEGAHADGIGRTFNNAAPWVPVIDAKKITIRCAEDIIDGYRDDGEIEIDGVRVAFYRDPFDKEFVWFFNPGDDIEEPDDGRIIARFEVERTVVRA